MMRPLWRPGFIHRPQKGFCERGLVEEALSKKTRRFLRPKKPPHHWDSVENQRAFLVENFSKGGGPLDLESLYKLKNEDLIRLGGSTLLLKHNSSLFKVLQATFPEHHWEETKFYTRPRNFWAFEENQRRFLLEVGSKVGLKEGDLSEWYKVGNDAITNLSGRRLLDLHGESISQTLRDLYPAHPWDLSKFHHKPRNHWGSIENQKVFMINLGSKLGFDTSNMAHWYKLSNENLLKNGGSGLLDRHSGSVSKLLAAIFPDHSWDLSKFSKATQGFWNSPLNRRHHLVELGSKLGITEGNMDGWYKVTREELLKLGGASLLSNRGGAALSTLLISAFPEHPWDLSRFENKPKNYWAVIDNQKAFVEALAEKVGIKGGDLEKWYKVSRVDFQKNGGRGLLNHFSGSVPSLLASVYPEHPWQVWKFVRTKTQAKKDPAFLRRLLDYLTRSFDIKDKGDWVRVSKEAMTELGVAPVVRELGGIEEILRRAEEFERKDSVIVS